MNTLVEAGMNRDRAYKVVQHLSFEAVKVGKNLKELALKDKTVRRFLRRVEISKIFDIKWFLRNILR
jgi:adenylosuccinate lyase